MAAGPLLLYIDQIIARKTIVKQVAQENKKGNTEYKLATILLYEISQGRTVPSKDFHVIRTWLMTDRLIPGTHKLLQFYTSKVREQSDKVDADKAEITITIKELTGWQSFTTN